VVKVSNATNHNNAAQKIYSARFHEGWVIEITKLKVGRFKVFLDHGFVVRRVNANVAVMGSKLYLT
jgi:hypothetical protein